MTGQKQRLAHLSARGRGPSSHLGFALAAFLGFLLVAAATALAPGCIENPLYIGGTCAPGIVPGSACCPCDLPEDCPDGEPPIPAWCDGGADGDADGEGGSAAIEVCPGRCVPGAPEGWDGPWFLYEGPWLFPPDCPVEASNIPFEGVPDPQAIPLTCPTCACGDPAGACKLPETWTVSSESCAGSGGVLTNFDPPSPWDGTCAADDAIPAGKLCDGKPCVRSISVSAPVIEEAPCEVPSGAIVCGHVTRPSTSTDHRDHPSPAAS